jgi:hypothetical protein
MPKFPDFQKLWDAYPVGEAADVKKEIGGAVNADWITNTCTIRLSRAFNKEGTFKIPLTYEFADKKAPLKLNTVKGGDGNRYAYRVAEMLKFLKAKFGKPQLRVFKKRGDGVVESFKGRKGLIVFNDCGWSDATGHVDLWNGEKCVGHEYWEKAKEVYLWTPEARWVVTPAINNQLQQGTTPIVSVGRG